MWDFGVIGVFWGFLCAAPTGGCRYDSSLGLLTKKFVRLVESAPEGVLDLNKAADSLQVEDADEQGVMVKWRSSAKQWGCAGSRKWFVAFVGV
jgi:E2F/DP family winged-helix DNA-binding domain